MQWPGTCEWLADVDSGPLTRWITSIHFAQWPQQHPVDDQLRPAMVSDPGWLGFGARSDDTVAGLATILGNPRISNRLISVVMPGHDITPHKDEMGEDWICRVHIPLTANNWSKFIIDGKVYHMRAGSAYRVNVTKTHSVVNNGITPRIHLMFDCYG